MNELLFVLSDELNEEKVNISNSNFENLLGQIILNKVVGTSFYNLDKNTAPKEFVKSLEILNDYNLIQTFTFENNLAHISKILIDAPFKYAFLKGAFLTTKLYKKGHRTSNDIDVLIEEKDITLLQELLVKNSFVQGRYDKVNNNIIAASRKEIVLSRMNYGETIPFLKIHNGSVLEIDINFSLDYKPSEDKYLVSKFLNNVKNINMDSYNFYTLDNVDFIIHLCCHLFKEATTINWVKNRRDLMLYKFNDINLYLNTYGNEKFFNELAIRIKALNLQNECYYTFVNCSKIYRNISRICKFSEFVKKIEPHDLNFMKQIINPKEKKQYKYNIDFIDWFFCEDRMKILNEINGEF